MRAWNSARIASSGRTFISPALTVIGAGNRFHAGCVIGDAPQDLKYKNEPTRLRIGDHNVFREHVTVHRSTKPDARNGHRLA
jgi:acyl-[acyl carrier protein]--UDP-N-acetylglucosamine O-acyltransferase